MSKEIDSLEPSQTDLFGTFEEAREVFNRALPNFRCVVCQNEHQALVGGDIEGQHTRINLHRPDKPIADSYIPTLTLICLNCGYVMSFVQSEIKRLAARKDPENG
jgi:hypothetical protein